MSNTSSDQFEKLISSSQLAHIIANSIQRNQEIYVESLLEKKVRCKFCKVIITAVDAFPNGSPKADGNNAIFTVACPKCQAVWIQLNFKLKDNHVS